MRIKDPKRAPAPVLNQNKITMIDNLSPDTQKAVKILAESLTPILDEIHATAPSSKNYYADYLAILTTYEPKYKKLLAIAMLYSGANLDGIEDALKLI